MPDENLIQSDAAPKVWRNPTKPELKIRLRRRKLECRHEPYWNLILYGRHIGYQKRRTMKACWMARNRTKNGQYRRRRLGLTDDRHSADGVHRLSFEQAVNLAWEWFKESGVIDDAAEAKPIGINETILCPPSGDTYTVGHALSDYLDWKRLNSSKSYTQTIVAHINFHLMPRIGHIPADGFNSEHVRIFIKDVLETPPKRGNPRLGHRLSIEDLGDEALRKRRKTINSLISGVRPALYMAWENGKCDNERAWRVLRYLPNVDQPRLLHLSRPECVTLLSACPDDLRNFVLGALYTGCRATELLRMEAGDVGRDGYGVYITPVKCYRPRFVFLPDEGMAFFLALTENKRPREKLFTRSNGRPWFDNYKHPFKLAVRSTGLPDEFCFHGLRHTYASQLIQSGALSRSSLNNLAIATAIP